MLYFISETGFNISMYEIKPFKTQKLKPIILYSWKFVNIYPWKIKYKHILTA